MCELTDDLANGGLGPNKQIFGPVEGDVRAWLAASLILTPAAKPCRDGTPRVICTTGISYGRPRKIDVHCVNKLKDRLSGGWSENK